MANSEQHENVAYLHSLARSLSQYMQSAALPDMVPSR